MSRPARSRLYLFCMVIRIAFIKYGACYSGTKLVLSRCIGTLRVSISGYSDTASSTLSRRYSRCGFCAKYVQYRCEGKYFRCADAVPMRGVSGAKCVRERAVDPPRVPIGRGNIPYCIRAHVRISTECERMYPNAYGKYMYPRSCTSAASRVSVRVSGESSPACVTPGAGMFCTPEN